MRKDLPFTRIAEFDDYPVRIVGGKEVGFARRMVATRDIKVDEVLWREEPLLSVLDGIEEDQMNSPFAGSFWLRCDWLYRPPTLPQSGSPLYAIGALQYLIARHPNLLLDTRWMDVFHDTLVSELQTHLYEAVRKLVPPLVDSSEESELKTSKVGRAMRRFLRIVIANAMPAVNMLSGQQYAIVLYQWASIFNHSCDNNARHCIGSFHELVVRANRPIKAGEHVTLSYESDMMLFEPHPQTRTLSSFREHCLCERCARISREEPLYTSFVEELAQKMRDCIAETVRDIPDADQLYYSEKVALTARAGAFNIPMEVVPFHTYALMCSALANMFWRQRDAGECPDEVVEMIEIAAQLLAKGVERIRASAQNSTPDALRYTQQMSIASTYYQILSDAESCRVARKNNDPRCEMLLKRLPLQRTLLRTQMANVKVVGDTAWIDAIITQAYTHTKPPTLSAESTTETSETTTTPETTAVEPEAATTTAETTKTE